MDENAFAEYLASLSELLPKEEPQTTVLLPDSYTQKMAWHSNSHPDRKIPVSAEDNSARFQQMLKYY